MKKSLKNIMKPFLKNVLQIFWGMHRPLVFKNKNLQNIHAGETCFIFANGGSLKYYDISKLPDVACLACTFSLTDDRMKSLNPKYYVVADSYALYSLLFNTQPHVRRFQVNKMKLVFEDIFKTNRDTKIFVNISNFYAKICRRTNIQYYHYFEDRNSFKHDLAGSFSNCRGSLDTMLGVAKYLGFTEALLFGCDYLGTSPMEGHFYSDKKPSSSIDKDYFQEYHNKVKLAADGIDVTVILPKGVTSTSFKSESYEDRFGLERENNKNNDIIDGRHLKMLRDAAASKQIYM